MTTASCKKGRRQTLRQWSPGGILLLYGTFGQITPHRRILGWGGWKLGKKWAAWSYSQDTIFCETSWNSPQFHPKLDPPWSNVRSWWRSTRCKDGKDNVKVFNMRIAKHTVQDLSNCEAQVALLIGSPVSEKQVLAGGTVVSQCPWLLRWVAWTISRSEGPRSCNEISGWSAWREGGGSLRA